MYYVIKKWYGPNFVIYTTNIEFLQEVAHIPKSKTYNDIIPIHHTHHNVKIIMFLYRIYEIFPCVSATTRK